MMKYVSIFLLLICLQPFSFSQDSLKIQDLKEVRIEKKRLFQRQGLYDSYEGDNTPSINGFTQLTIFENQMSDEVWSSEGKECVDLSLKTDIKNNFLNVKWNKDQDGCDWVGIGFGWDFWSSKDMGQIVDLSAIQIELRSKGKEMNNLPWAFGLEDYAGGQAWTGFARSFAPNGKITNEWTKIQIPLALFPFVEYDCDPSNIKQLLIQLFAQDEVEIKSIRIVPFLGKLKQDILSTEVALTEIQVDGKLQDWNQKFVDLDESHSFSIVHSKDSLYIALKIKDDSPRMNNKTKGELWNGDAIEIAFATNPTANPKRNLFLLSDYHIGINCGKNPYMWNFSEDKLFENGRFAITSTADGYQVELVIAFNELTGSTFSSEQTYGFEIAVDAGDKSYTRKEQIRWNSQDREGFHLNPSLWGTLIIQ